jgi:hypothetical protein
MDTALRATVVDRFLDWLGRRLAGKLTRTSPGYHPFTFSEPAALRRALRPADVLLVEGNQRLSSVIKYFTQSTWSHAALFVGDAVGAPADGGELRCLIEANLEHGVVAVPLSKYASFNTRICRAGERVRLRLPTPVAEPAPVGRCNTSLVEVSRRQ